MKVEYNIKRAYSDKYTLTYTLIGFGPTPMPLNSMLVFDGFTLRALLSKARNVINSRMNYLRKEGIIDFDIKEVTFVWDENTEGLPEAIRDQHIRNNTMFCALPKSAVAETPTIEEVPEAEPEQPKTEALYEIAKVNDVWTLHKHEEPLLTWAKACEILKQKVENND